MNQAIWTQGRMQRAGRHGWLLTLQGALLLGMGTAAQADLAPPSRRNDPLAGSSPWRSRPGGASATPEVTGGSLDKEVIRRVIQRHAHQVRYCYEKGLAKNPTLEGTVAVAFRINAEGNVESSVVKQSTLNNPEVDSCIAGLVLRWAFPKPVGGTVGVTYPFVLRTSESVPNNPTQPEGNPVPNPAPSTNQEAANSGSWFAFSTYPGARRLCWEHVRGAGPRPIEIEWHLYATSDAVAKVLAHYEREAHAKPVRDAARGGVGLSSKADARDMMSIFPIDKRGNYPGCSTEPQAGDKTLILVSRGTGR